MSFELVFTSASRGLRRGASGFCTVAATDGIPRALQDKLESLSGYRHTEAAHGHAPPVNHSHLTVRIQRNIYHVVSRIGDPGMDYSGRSNKIAHHLALTSAELERFPEGPSALFSDDRFWYEKWDRDPETLEPGRVPHVDEEFVSGFNTWEDVFGDAGWAGIMGYGVADGMKSVSVIVPDTEDTLTLLNEALQLVPAQDRWKVCFSTYYSRHVSGMQCHWRFVLDGTSEARKLRARVQGLLIDPSGSAGRLPANNPFVEAARSGRPEDAFTAKRPRRRGAVRQAETPLTDTPSRADTPPTTSKRTSSNVAAVDDDDEDEENYKPQFGQPRRRKIQKQQKPKLVAKSPFDIPEEEFADDPYDDEKNNQPKNRKRGSQKKQRTGLWLLAALALAVLGILTIFGIQQLT